MKRSNQPIAARTHCAPARRLAAVVLAASAAVGMAASFSQAGVTYAWGLNQYGQIGNGTTGAGGTGNSPTSPVPVTGMTTGVSALGAGAAHSLVAKNGALYGWGLTLYGQTGDGTGNGSTITSTTTPQPGIVLTSGVTAVSGGQYYSMAIANGTLYSFGANTGGVLANGVSGNSVTPLPVIGMGGGVTAIATGAQHAVAIKNGAAYAWGYAVYGQIGDGGAVGGTTPNVTTPYQIPSLASGVTLVGAGQNHSMAVKDNVLYAWGSNQYGQLGNNGTTGTSTLSALYSSPQAVVGLPAGTITDIAAGQTFSMALVNGAVYTWGQNSAGQLGNGSTSISATPVAVSGITGTIVDIEAGSSAAYALDADGSLWDWGNNTYGQLGIGSSTTSFTTPQHLFAPVGYRFTDIEAGDVASQVLVTESALPVYFKGQTSGTLTDVSNYTTTVAGTTAAPIAPVESTDIYFGTTNATVANLTATVGTGMVANSLTFGTGASATNAVTINGSGPITLYADKNSYAAGTGIVVQSGSAAVTINAPITLGASQSWTTNATTPFTVNGSVDLGTSTLTLAGTGAQAITGIISGSGSVTVNGAGTTTLTGANTYTGTTSVKGGTLKATSPAYTNLLSNAGGVDLGGSGVLVLDHTSAASPVGTVGSLLTSAYASNFASGQIRSTTLAAGRTIGYGDSAGLLTIRITLPGDADLDGKVDFNDFLVLQNNFNQSNTTFGQGNFDYNTVTDFNDFLVLQNNFGQSITGAAISVTASEVAALTAFASAVPEPSLMAVAGLGMAAALRRSRHLRSH